MKEVLKLALEALENHCGNYKLDDAGCERWNKAVDAIKEALALTSTQCEVQPEQEPDMLTIAYMSGLYDGKKKRPWVGLTDEEIDDIYWQHESKLEHQVFIWPYERTIEAKLKEKNT